MSRHTRIFQTPLALVAVGILLSACGTDDNSEGGTREAAVSPSTSPTPTRSTAAAQPVVLPDGVLALPAAPANQEPPPLDAGRYRVPLGDSVAFDVDLPQGTISNSDGLYLQSDPNILKVELAGQDYGVPLDPCHRQDIEPAGRTVRALVSAIRDQPVYRVSRVRPVTIGGGTGVHLQIAIPAGYDASFCEGGQVGLPGTEESHNNMPSGYVADWWVLDAHGHRVVAQEFCDGCTARQRSRVARQVQTITFPASP